jgi:hypothetical protein
MYSSEKHRVFCEVLTEFLNISLTFILDGVEDILVYYFPTAAVQGPCIGCRGVMKRPQLLNVPSPESLSNDDAEGRPFRFRCSVRHLPYGVENRIYILMT